MSKMKEKFYDTDSVKYHSRGLLRESIYYSPIRQQWLVAFDTNGTASGLIPRSWHNKKLDALLELKAALQFREGLIANCESICHEIDKINIEIKRIQGGVK